MALLLLGVAGCQSSGEVSDEPGETLKPVLSAPPPAASAQAPSAASSGGLVGMTVETLRAAWGEPSLKRTETGAELWQYGGQGNCTLLVYFYANAASVMTVTHAEAVPGGSDEAAIASCAKAAGKPSLKPVS